MWKIRFDRKKLDGAIPEGVLERGMSATAAMNEALKLLQYTRVEEVAIIHPDSSILGWFRISASGTISFNSK